MATNKELLKEYEANKRKLSRSMEAIEKRGKTDRRYQDLNILEEWKEVTQRKPRKKDDIEKANATLNRIAEGEYRANQISKQLSKHTQATYRGLVQHSIISPEELSYRKFVQMNKSGQWRDFLDSDEYKQLNKSKGNYDQFSIRDFLLHPVEATEFRKALNEYILSADTAKAVEAVGTTIKNSYYSMMSEDNKNLWNTLLKEAEEGSVKKAKYVNRADIMKEFIKLMRS